MKHARAIEFDKAYIVAMLWTSLGAGENSSRQLWKLMRQTNREKDTPEAGGTLSGSMPSVQNGL